MRRRPGSSTDAAEPEEQHSEEKCREQGNQNEHAGEPQGPNEHVTEARLFRLDEFRDYRALTWEVTHLRSEFTIYNLQLVHEITRTLRKPGSPRS